MESIRVMEMKSDGRRNKLSKKIEMAMIKLCFRLLLISPETSNYKH
jgi:hypothetical protein